MDDTHEEREHEAIRISVILDHYVDKGILQAIKTETLRLSISI